MYLGVDYYPHYFNDTNLNNDLLNIKNMNANFIRIGDFSWQLVEPTEGNYSFDYFHNVVKACEDLDIKVMICTPTSTFPAWLKQKYDDILIVDEHNQKISFGGRREYCYNSPNFLKYAKIITKKMVDEFKGYKNVINFQVDNEFGHENSDICYCHNCLREFQLYLKNKYNDINILNDKAGNVFWSKSYTCFEEIELPRKTITYHNPLMLLEWYRFRNYSINRFAKELINVINDCKLSNQEVTHNFFPGFFNVAYDQNELSKNIDFVSYDNYPVWGGLKEPVEPAQTALSLDYIRGLQNKNFWIVEQIMGAQGHDIIGYLPKKNQSKMWSYQAFARGCNNLLYFSYRTLHKGQEQFCYGLLNSDNKINNRYFEAKSFFEDISKYDKLFDSHIDSKIAVVYDYDNISAWKFQKQSVEFDFMNEILRFYRAFYNLSQNIDVVNTTKKLDDYDIIIVPVMQIIDEEFYLKLKSLTNEKRTIIFTYRSGIKDKENSVFTDKSAPGFIGEMVGAEIKEIEALQKGQEKSINFENEDYMFDTFREELSVLNATPYAKYDDGGVAITKNKFNEATVIYVGGGLDKGGCSAIAKSCLIDHNISFEETDDSIEIITRNDGEFTYKIYINHSNENIIYNDIKLEAFEVKIVKE